MSIVSNVVWLTVVLYTRLKPNGKFRMGLKESNALNASHCLLKSHLSCLAICIYFVLNSAQSSGKN